MNSRTPVQVYELPTRGWVLLVAVLATMLAVSYTGLMRMADTWFTREEYSHGVLVPLIAAFLIWQRKPELQQVRFIGSWLGVAIVLFGSALKIAGDIGTFYIVEEYAVLLTFYGLVLALTGWQAFRILLVPLLILLFMIPLPDFILQSFSSKLQLISSQIGVMVIRAFGISVYAEGNVIDLGGYKLQVAEACDGLRYLFPLMTLGFLMAYFFKVAAWKRVLLFLSTIPITIAMNSFRIGSIGVMVEYWGIGMAEGFLHDFQGWVVFMASTAILLLEMAVLARIGGDRQHWREAFGVQFPGPSPRDANRATRRLPPTFAAGAAVLVGCFTLAALMPERPHSIPQRDAFFSFPARLDAWNGRHSVLDQIYIDTLQLDDYVMSDFLRSDRDLVNLFIGWYDTQAAGRVPHSPRICLPSGGWQIDELTQRSVPGIQAAGVPLRVNRVEMRMGDQRSLVYYWFQQRGRIVTGEYAAKWFLFWDGLTRRRTDGALVRLVTPIRADESTQAADARLEDFAARLMPQLQRHIPD